MFFEDTSRASKVLMSLRDLGVKLYIDDFGTGYSSFTYLHEFPATGLKIDKSFVELVGLPERPAAIVPTIISLAHSLSLDVVAEGVETPHSGTCCARSRAMRPRATSSESRSTRTSPPRPSPSGISRTSATMPQPLGHLYRRPGATLPTLSGPRDPGQPRHRRPFISFARPRFVADGSGPESRDPDASRRR